MWNRNQQFVFAFCLATVCLLGLTRQPLQAQVPNVRQLLAVDGQLGDEFGTSVALSGSTLVVGTYQTNGGAGAAYVYNLSGNTWILKAKLTPSNPQPGQAFGARVAISGNTIAVGSPFKNGTGAAYIYTLTVSGWSETVVLTASDVQQGDLFGDVVRLSGNTLAVSAPYKNNRAGAAYIFTRNGANWVQRAKLTANDAQPSDFFSADLAISGTTLVSGATQENGGSGAAYVFTLNGNTWTQKAKLTASDGHPGDRFGYSVALSGNMIAVGARDRHLSIGAVYMFTLLGVSWEQEEILTAEDGRPGDGFGHVLAFSGNRLAVGACGLSTPGAVYLYNFSAQGFGVFKMTASDGQPGDVFGIVALNGTTLAVGAPYRDGHTGAVYTTP